ncbi:MAG: hypothetical protein LBW85_01390 [Deltaproteobacteria bacterium]|jgi:hypothetical protein|nr:hypothetical protein [Deltaproteobacteria bacterium]
MTVIRKPLEEFPEVSRNIIKACRAKGQELWLVGGVLGMRLQDFQGKLYRGTFTTGQLQTIADVLDMRLRIDFEAPARGFSTRGGQA